MVEIGVIDVGDVKDVGCDNPKRQIEDGIERYIKRDLGL